MRYANIATVMVHGRNELHLRFNNDADLRTAYDEVTREWMLDKALTRILNHKAAVEQELFDMARGKLPMPDAAKLHELAMKLGGC